MMQLVDNGSPLLGRDRELEAVMALLAGDARWVTLVGLGGVGKSRLALEVARRAAAAGGTAHVCDLVATRGVDEAALAMTAGLTRPPGARGGGLVDELAAGLVAGGVTLLVIDNVEHLAPALARLLLELLARSPALGVLATSRVPLGHPAERSFLLLPLDCDGPDSPAVALLARRARSPHARAGWQADRAALERLARRLDGIPLALELAAARAHLVAPSDLEGLLDDRFALVSPARDPRQASRDAAIGWAWEQLSDLERAALGRLSVVAGSFDLALALALVPAPRDTRFAVVEQLARYGLVVPARSEPAARFQILETVREYALARTTQAARADAISAMGEAILGRFPVKRVLGFLDEETTRAALAERDRLLQLLRNGREEATPEALALALRAAAILFSLFRRSGFELALVESVRALFDLEASADLPVDVQLAAGLPTVAFLANGSDSDGVDRLAGKLELAAREDPTALAWLAAARGLVMHYRWRYRPLLPLAERLVAGAEAARDPSLNAVATELLVFARRALGASDPMADDRLLAVASDRLRAAGMAEQAFVCGINRAFLAVQLGRPELAIALLDRGDAEMGAQALQRFVAYTLRERARAEGELGARGRALDCFTRAVDAFADGPASTQWLETVLDRAALALELGRYDLARPDIATGLTHAGTVFARAYADALARALWALVRLAPSSPAGAAAAGPTDTVEDEALALWSSLDAPERARGVAASTSAAACSFRFRQARRVQALVDGLASEAPSTLGVSLDGAAYRLGPTWNDLSPRPLARRLLELVLAPAFAGEPGPTRAEAADGLWPGERMSERSRGQRLRAVVVALAEHGLPLVLGERVTLPPGVQPLRVDPAAWPGHATVRRRGRGRPRKEIAPDGK